MVKSNLILTDRIVSSNYEKVFHILKNIKIGPLDAQQLNFVKKLEKIRLCFFLRWLFYIFPKKI